MVEARQGTELPSSGDKLLLKAFDSFLIAIVLQWINWQFSNLQNLQISRFFLMGKKNLKEFLEAPNSS